MITKNRALTDLVAYKVGPTTGRAWGACPWTP